VITLTRLEELISILIRKFDQYFKPRAKIPYSTGRLTLPSSTDWSDRSLYHEHLLYVYLGYRPASGYIFNHGPGNIYVRLSADGQAFSEKEITIFPDGIFSWGDENPPLKIASIWVRSDSAGTEYELCAG